MPNVENLAQFFFTFFVPSSFFFTSLESLFLDSFLTVASLSSFASLV